MLLTEARLAAEGVKGWLSAGEQTLLYDLARQVPAEGTIVELGSWMGRSTIVLGAGSLSKPRATVYAVDLFAERKDVNAAEYSPHLDASESDYLPVFDRNIRGAGVEAVVVPIRGMTIEAARQWRGPRIDLLFIDADHSYEGVRNDFLEWSSHCKQGAWCAFHDYFNLDKPGVQQFVDLLVAAGIIDEIRTGDSILCGRLKVVDRAEIENILRVSHRRSRSAWPESIRTRWYELLVGAGWTAFVLKRRRQALSHAMQALLWNPWRSDAWRLTATALLKPVRSSS